MNKTDRQPCPACFGTGQKPLTQWSYPMRKIVPDFCWECDGTGRRSEPSAKSDTSEQVA